MDSWNNYSVLSTAISVLIVLTIYENCRTISRDGLQKRPTIMVGVGLIICVVFSTGGYVLYLHMTDKMLELKNFAVEELPKDWDQGMTPQARKAEFEKKALKQREIGYVQGKYEELVSGLFMSTLGWAVIGLLSALLGWFFRKETTTAR